MVGVIAVAALWVCVAVLLVVGWPRFATHRGWRVAVLVGALGVSLVHQLTYGTVPDEAHVAFRYAHNIADGYGPVFNPGEYVEGYTDFAWIVLVALGRAVTGADVEPVAVVLGVACALGCVLLTYAVTRRILRGSDPAFAMAAAVVVAGIGALAAHGPSGTSTPAFVLLVLTLAYALVSGHIVVAGAVAALAVMTRLDGVVVALVALVWLAITALGGRVARVAPAVYLAGAAVPLVPWFAWRLTFYGEMVPTAVVAAAVRGNDSPAARLGAGWTYAVDFALAYQAFLLVAAVTIGVLSYRRRVGARHVWLLLALALAEVAYVVAVGGSSSPAWGPLTPVPVLLTVAAAAGFALAGTAPPSATATRTADPARTADPGTTAGVPKGRGIAVVAVALAGLSLAVSLTRTLPGMHELRAVEDELGDIGGWLGTRLSAGTVVSAVPAGALADAAGSGVYVVDPSGTTDAHLARHPGDHAYVVRERMPAVVVDAAGGYRSERACEIRDEYAGPYEVVPFRRFGDAHAPDRWIELYLHRPQAELLTEALGSDPRFSAVPC